MARKISDYLKIVNGSAKNKTYTFATFTLVVMLVLLVGAVRPTLSTIANIREDIKDKERIDEQLSTKINTLTGLRQQFSDIRVGADYLPLIFPTEGNFSLFMANIEEITKENGFKLTGLNFGKEDEVADLNVEVLEYWGATINVSGRKSNIIDLLENIEAMPMYPVITGFSYANKVDDDGLTDFSINVALFKIDQESFYD